MSRTLIMNKWIESGWGHNSNAVQTVSAVVGGISQAQQRIIFISLLLTCVFVRLPFFFPSVIDWDESTFVLMGQNILDGRLPYTELWDNKPPLLFLFFALVMIFEQSIFAVRVAGAICVLACAYLTYRIGDHIWRQPAGFLAGMLSIVFVSFARSGQATMAEIVALVPLMGALALLVTKGSKPATPFFTGLFLSIATLIRLNLAFVACIVGIVMIVRPLLNRRGFESTQITTYVLGGFIPLAIVSAAYIIDGNAELFLKSVFLAPLYYATSTESSKDAIVFLLKWGFGYDNILLWLGFLGGVVCIGKSWSNFDNEQKRGIGLVAVFFFSVGCSVIFAGGAFLHYLIQLIPFLALIAGSFFSFFYRYRYRFIITLFLLLGCAKPLKPVVAQYFLIGKELAAREFLLSDPGFEIASYLRRENPSRKPIYMMTDHIVYWLTGTKPLRKSVTHPSMIAKENLLRVFVGPYASPESEMSALLRQRPLYIVKEKEIWYLKGNAAKLLEATLETDYVLVKVFGERYIYKRSLN
jgi:hypothetical protein